MALESFWASSASPKSDDGGAKWSTVAGYSVDEERAGISAGPEGWPVCTVSEVVG